MFAEVPYSFFALVALPLAYALGIYAYRRHILWSSGIIGEGSVSRELRRLGDEYYQVDGVVIPPNRGDTDHIVIGPNGIFVIESKNYGGEIECQGDLWKRYKKSGKGNRYDIPVGSPSRQVKRNAKVLKDFLLKHKDEIFEGDAPHIWVHSLVVFTNPNLNLTLRDPSVDVLRLDELIDHVSGKESDLILSLDECRAMGDVILRYSH